MKNWIKNAQKKTARILIAMSMIGLWQGTAHTMEDDTDEDYTETSKLLSIHEDKSLELMDPLSDHKETLPFFPQDIWSLIVTKCLFPQSTPAPYNQNTPLEWKNIVYVSETCRSLNHFLRNFIPFNITSKINLWDLQLTTYINTQKDKTNTYIEETEVSDLKNLKSTLEDLTCQIKQAQNALEINGLKNEKWVLDYLNKDTEKRESDLKPLIQNVLRYAKENHQKCDDNSVFIDLEYLAQATETDVPSYKWKGRREYRRIFTNKKILTSLAACAGFWACFWSIKAANWHFKHYPYNASQEAYDAMLNQTTKAINSSYWGWRYSSSNNPPPCFTKCYLNGWDSMYISRNYMDHETRYATFEGTRCCDGEHKYLGNESDWIRFVADKCGVSFSFWFDQVMAIANGTRANSEMDLCSLNPDGVSITCGNAFKQTWPRTAPSCSEGLCLHLTRGDAVCAANQIIKAWKMTTAHYASVGFGVPLILSIFILIGFCI